MMKKSVLLFILLLSTVSAVFAQEITVKGKVMDAASGEPLPGVSVADTKHSGGTITDIDGLFALSVTKGTVLQFSFIGYETQNYSVTSDRFLSVSLAEKTQAIDEVVVVGAAMKKSDLTGAVASVDAEQLKEIPTANLNQAMQGKIPGVYVEANPQPGANATIKVRGNNSISYGTSPLYVIDNIMIDDTDISTINPNDIASIEVLKDAST